MVLEALGEGWMFRAGMHDCWGVVYYRTFLPQFIARQIEEDKLFLEQSGEDHLFDEGIQDYLYPCSRVLSRFVENYFS